MISGLFARAFAASWRHESGPGMIPVMCGFEAVLVDVRVDLSGRNVHVPQHLLHRPDIRSARQQMRSKGMAKGMGIDILVDPG